MNELKLFYEQEIRTVWDEKEKEWYFSVVDVVGVLSESEYARKYYKSKKQLQSVRKSYQC